MGGESLPLRQSYLYRLDIVISFLRTEDRAPTPALTRIAPIATPVVSKHRVFRWVDSWVWPTNLLDAIATFETFPFPEGLTPNIPALQYANDPRAIAIAVAARELNEKREAWLNPPEWVDRVPEVVPGYPDRIVPKPGHEADLSSAR